MANKNVISTKIQISADISDYQAKLAKIQDGLKSINLSDSLTDEFSAIFSRINKEIEKIQTLTANEKINLVDAKEVEKSFKTLETQFNGLVNKINSTKVGKSLNIVDKEAITLLKQVEAAEKKIISDKEKEQKIQKQAYNQNQKDLKELEVKKNSAEKQENDIRSEIEKQTKELDQQLALRKQITNEKTKLTKSRNNRVDEQTFKEQYGEAHAVNDKPNYRGWTSAWQKYSHDTSDEVYSANYKELTAQGKEADAQIKILQADLEGLNTKLESAKVATANSSKAFEEMNKTTEESRQKFDNLGKDLENLKVKSFDNIKQALEDSKIDWSQYNIDPSTIKSFDDLKEAITRIENTASERTKPAIAQINKILDDARSSGANAAKGFNDAEDALEDMYNTARDLEHLSQQIKSFFTIGNAVQLFKRAIRSAYETVKDLDAVMTETAVVTDFSVGDMWNQLPEYTQRANELGVSIHSAYEAATIYYQQGLKTNEVMAVSNATLKMARIASLDAAIATDRMTNALRGFNMEINETNANNISDVYSKLAAISASNVDEISTAMTKVASLANSANMEFETTAAFLAQMIETTRESAETAGTALKTVVARFSEVKKLYTEGELSGTDEEGEAIDVNKVATALRTAGIDLNEYFLGAKGLDDIFIELASKWDSLDRVQQRYIATQAAGSRQQSRFIAMMSDYGRTQELVAAAQNASGAANEQYNKTLDSLETKLTKLKNAWDEFLMSLANSNAIKAVVDGVTQLITNLNDLIGLLSGDSGTLKSVSAVMLSLGGLKLGRELLNPKGIGSAFVQNFITEFKQDKPGVEKEFINVGKDLSKSFKNKFKELNPKNLFTGWENVEKLQEVEIPIDVSSLKFSDFEISEDQRNKLKQAIQEAVPKEALTDDTFQDYMQNDNFDEAAKYVKNYGTEIKFTHDQLKEFGIEVKAQYKKVGDLDGGFNKLTSACTTAGSAFLIFGTLIDKIAGKSTIAGKIFKNVGVTLLGLVPVLNVVKTSIKTFAVESTAAIESIPIIGWIAVAITALVVIATTIAELTTTPKEAAENAKNALEEANEAVVEAQENVQNLEDAWVSLTDKTEALDGLVRGTKEWQDAVYEVNQQVLGLMDTYDDLKIKNENGILTITNYDDVLNNAKNQKDTALTKQIGANINNLEAQKTLEYDSLSRAIRGAIGNNTSWEGMASQTLMESLSRALATGEITTIIDTKEFITNNGGSSNANLTEEDLEYLRHYGETIIQLDEQTNAYYISLGAVAQANANLASETEEAVNVFASNTEKLKTLVDTEENNLTNKRWLGTAAVKAKDDDMVSDFRKWVTSIKGEVTDERKGIYKIGDKEYKFSDKAVKAQFATWRAQQKLTEQIENFSQAIKSANTNVRKAFGQDGNFFLKDFDVFGNLDQSYEDYITSDNNQDWLDVGWNSLGERGQSAYANDKEFKKEYYSLIQEQYAAYKDSINALSNMHIHINDKLDSQAYSALTNSLEIIYNQIGYGYAQSIEDSVEAIGTGLSDDLKQKFYNAFGQLDLTSTTSVRGFKDSLDKLGISVDNTKLDNLIDQIVDLGIASNKVSLEGLTERLDPINTVIDKIQDNINNDTSTFTSEEVATLIENGISSDQFVMTGLDGTYTYLGSQNNLLTQIRDKTSKILGEISQDTALNQSIQFGEAFKQVNYENMLTELQEVNVEKYGEEAARAMASGMADEFKDGKTDVFEFLQSAGILNDTDKIDRYTTDQLQSILENAYNKYYGYNGQILEQNLNEQDNINRRTQELTYSTIGQESAQALLNEQPTTELETKAYDSAINALIKNEAGLSQEVEKVTNDLKGQKSELYENENITRLHALQIAQDAKQIDTLNDKVKDNTDILQNAATDSYEYQTALGSIAEKAKKVFGDQVDDEFVNQYKDLFIQLSEGGEEGQQAFVELAKASVSSITGIDNKLTGLDISLRDIFNQSLEFKIGETHDFSKIIRDAKLTEEEIENLVAILSALGSVNLTPKYEVKYAVDGLGMYSTMKEALKAVDSIGGLRKAKVETVKQFVGFEEFGGFVFTRGSGLGTGKNAAGKTSKPSNKDSNSKEKLWENPYDELYNLQEQINAQIRIREKLERNYDKLLDNRKAKAKDLVKNSYAEIAALEKEIALQKDMLSGRQRQMNNVANETYVDSEGNKRTYSQMGVTKYASYDSATQTITIDWDAINQITNEDEGGAVEAYISRMEELRDSIQDTKDAVEDCEDQIVEIKERGKEEYVNFEEKVYNALIAEREKFIESLENINDSITDATNKTIQSIQDEIDKERQERQNEEDRQDIYDKEMRLAYLQRDTSGANALEIQQLQQEIAQDQQSYTDSLIDQTIQEMQDEANRAENQRQAQIDILNAQLEYDKEHGTYWTTVETLLQQGIDADGAILPMSDLDTLLQENENVAGMSRIGTLNWQEEMAKEVAKAMLGRSSWEMQQAEESGKMTLANGTVLTYNKSTGQWSDSNGNTYSNFNWNMDKEAFTADKQAKPTNSTASTSTSSVPAKTSSPYIGQITAVADNSAYIRNQSSSTGAILGWTRGGEVFDVVEEVGNWYHIKYNGQDAYTYNNDHGIPTYTFKRYATGGMVDSTGPAWLDGTKSRPEMVLNASDTKNLITLKDILGKLLNNSQNGGDSGSGGDNYFDINISADIGSDYDVDKLASRIKQRLYDDAAYRNVNFINYIR